MCNVHTLLNLLNKLSDLLYFKFCLLALPTYKRNMLKYSTKIIDLSISACYFSFFVCLHVYKYIYIYIWGYIVGGYVFFMSVIVLWSFIPVKKYPPFFLINFLLFNFAWYISLYPFILTLCYVSYRKYIPKSYIFNPVQKSLILNYGFNPLTSL